MLLRFTVSNYLSICDKITFSMIPSTQKTNDENLIKIDNINVLRFGVIYGANAAGKSNIIKALKFGKDVFFKGLTTMSSNDYCRMDKKNADKPSQFEYTFFSNGEFYSYGFSLSLSKVKVLEEWLYKINPNTNSEQELLTILSKTDKAENVFKIKLTSNELNRMNTYLLDMHKKTNKLFVGDMYDKNLDKKSNNYKKLIDVVNWFKEVDITFADEPVDGYVLSDEKNFDKVSSILSLLDTGVSRVFYKPITFDELKVKVNDESIVKEVLKNISDLTEKENARYSAFIRGRYEFYRIDARALEEYKVFEIKLNHHHSPDDFDFKDESDGTRRLFDLLDILLTNKKNAIFFVDEIERSIHPVLLFKYFEMMKEIFCGKNIQVIVTTHETHILDQTLFRRDEIWFVERNEKGTSELYSLDIFKERYDKAVSKNYIKGRYGGIPIFKKLEANHATD